jgi:outer membrane protein insertion porin family
MKTLSLSILFIIISGFFAFPRLYSQPVPANERFIIENITIEGNKKTRTGVFFENLPFAIGDTLTETEIHAGIRQLEKRQFFHSVNLQPRPGSEPGKLNLTIQIKEKYWPALRFTGGFSEMSGWYLTPVSLNMDNLLGFGNLSNLNLTIGDRVTSLGYNYVNPNLFQSEMDFYFDLSIRSQQFLNYIQDVALIHEVTQIASFLGLKSRDGLFRNFLFGCNFYRTVPDSFFTYVETKQKYFDLPEKIRHYTTGEHTTTALSITYDLDKRDQSYYPQKGYWLGMWFMQASTGLGSKINFTRFILDARKYISVNKFVLAGRIKLGTISKEAPFYEKFYLGGPNSLRGYADRSLSPVGGGEKLVQGGLEFRFPMTTRHFPEHFLTGALFIDGGANLLTNEKINQDNFYGSYGFGFRLKLPFIRLSRIDVAYPMRGGENQIHFSIGHTF